MQRINQPWIVVDGGDPSVAQGLLSVLSKISDKLDNPPPVPLSARARTLRTGGKSPERIACEEYFKVNPTNSGKKWTARTLGPAAGCGKTIANEVLREMKQ